eukprot:2197967-Pyramimonas_sp.AAC.1
MDSSVALHCREHSAALRMQRLHSSVRAFPFSTGGLVVRPRQGVAMGGSCIVTMFLNAPPRPILSWGLDSVKKRCACEGASFGLGRHRGRPLSAEVRRRST